MKKIILLIAFFALAFAAFSQQTTPSPTLTKQDYLKKSKRQKAAAWILVSSGAFFTLLGSIELNFAGSDSIDGTDPTKKSAKTIFKVIGLTAVGVSIPFFISAAKNKKKAMALSFKNEISPQIYKTGFVYKPVPSLTLKISL